MQQLIYLHTTTDDKSQEQLQNSNIMHVSLCLCTRVRTTTVVPEESLENVAATEFKRRSWIFSERGRPWTYTRTYYSRVTSGRGEKNKKRDHCQRSQLYGNSTHPQQTTTATGQQLQQQQSSSKRARIDARTTRRPHTNKAPSRATNAAAAAERSGRRRQQTDYPSPDRGPENRKITSIVTSHVLPFPSPIARDIIMSHVPIFGS
jgi:hypothetical protein